MNKEAYKHGYRGSYAPGNGGAYWNSTLNRWNMETKRIERMVVTEEGVGWK